VLIAQNKLRESVEHSLASVAMQPSALAHYYACYGLSMFDEGLSFGSFMILCSFRQHNFRALWLQDNNEE